jgi:hypothetical protein
MTQELFGASWTAKLEELAGALRAVHKSLIDSTRRDYEKVHGRINGPYALFSLVAHDPAFAWLQPMTRLIVEIEEVQGRKSPAIEGADLMRARRAVGELLVSGPGDFGSAFQARVQADPDVAVEHGRLHALLRE